MDVKLQAEFDQDKAAFFDTLRRVYFRGDDRKTFSMLMRETVARLMELKRTAKTPPEKMVLKLAALGMDAIDEKVAEWNSETTPTKED